MSYPESPVVVLPLICPSRALALYVAHHDGKALVGGCPPQAVSASAVSVSRMCFCRCGSPPRVDCQQQQQ